MGAAVEAELTAAAAGHAGLRAGAALPRMGRTALGPVPAGFRLSRVARSHGWSGLPPTAYDGQRKALHRTLLLPDAGPLTVSVTQPAADRVDASWGRALGSRRDRTAVRRQLRRMLGLDDDLGELHAACAAVPEFAWIPATGAGRLLRSPTVWEDLAKTLATTNCSWSLTRAMTTRLVETLGERGPEGEQAFPTAAAVATAGTGHLRGAVRAGYRSTAFVELATGVHTRALQPERWLEPARSDSAVLTEIQQLRGFGPYAAEGMLGLLGRPRGLALDSWVRAKLPRLLGRAAMTDREIAERYAPLGRWAGTGLWLELTRDWFEPEPTAAGG